MSEYRVIVSFEDLQDRNHYYRPGDIFPRDGVIVSKERLEELASAKNKRRKPLIEKVETKPFMAEPITEQTEAEPQKPKASQKRKRDK